MASAMRPAPGTRDAGAGRAAVRRPYDAYAVVVSVVCGLVALMVVGSASPGYVACGSGGPTDAEQRALDHAFSIAQPVWILACAAMLAAAALSVMCRHTIAARIAAPLLYALVAVVVGALGWVVLALSASPCGMY